MQHINQFALLANVKNMAQHFLKMFINVTVAIHLNLLLVLNFLSYFFFKFRNFCMGKNGLRHVKTEKDTSPQRLPTYKQRLADFSVVFSTSHSLNEKLNPILANISVKNKTQKHNAEINMVILTITCHATLYCIKLLNFS